MPSEFKPDREVRFAVTMVGGTSLAIYIHGVALELLDMVNGQSADGAPNLYAVLKQITRSHAYVDVLSGTSAGGLNSIFLSAALVNRTSLEGVKRLFLEQADIDKLIQNPWNGELTSLFQGNDFYLPALRTATDSVIAGPGVKSRPPGPFASGYQGESYSDIDLFVTGTFHRGQPRTFLDSLSTPLFTRDYRGVFKLKHRQGGRSHFAPDHGEIQKPEVRRSREFQIARLARVARTTSSLPALFEPSRVTKREMGDEVIELGEGENAYAYMMDGGYLNGRPLNLVVEALNQRAVSQGRQVVRKVLLVEPKPDAFVKPVSHPTAPTALQDLLFYRDVPTRQELTGFLEDVDRHNYNARRVRQSLATLRSILPEIQSRPEQQQYQRDLWRRTCELEIVETLSGLFRSQRDLDDPAIAQEDYVSEERRRGKERSNWTELERQLQTFLKNIEDDEQLLRFDICYLHRKALRAIDEVYAAGRLGEPLAELYQQLDAAGRVHWSMQAEIEALFRADSSVEEWLVGLETIATAHAEQIQSISAEIDDLVCASSRHLQHKGKEDQPLRWVASGPSSASAGKYLRLLDQWLYPMERAASLLSRDSLDLVQVDPRQELGLCRREAAAKVAGDDLAKLGGFLHSAWRCNDVLWGRLDGSCCLIHSLLDPDALHRACQKAPDLVVKTLREYLQPSGEEEEDAWKSLEAALLRDKLPPAELSLLKDWLARRHHLQVLREELPDLLTTQATQAARWGQQPAVAVALADKQALRTASPEELQSYFEKHYAVGAQTYRDIPVVVNLRRSARMLHLAWVVATGSLQGRKVSDLEPDIPYRPARSPGWAAPLVTGLKPVGALLALLDLAAVLLSEGVVWAAFLTGAWGAAVLAALYGSLALHSVGAAVLLALLLLTPVFLIPVPRMLTFLGFVGALSLWFSPPLTTLFVALAFASMGLALGALLPRNTTELAYPPGSRPWLGRKVVQVVGFAACAFLAGKIIQLGYGLRPSDPPPNWAWPSLVLFGTAWTIGKMLGQGPLKSPGAPYGIVSLELCATSERAREIVQSWDSVQRKAAIRSTVWDFLLAPLYGATLFCLLWQWLPGWPATRWWALVAVVLDWVENVLMLRMLAPRQLAVSTRIDVIWEIAQWFGASPVGQDDPRPAWTTLAAGFKFLILALLSLLLIGAVSEQAAEQFLSTSFGRACLAWVEGLF